MLLCLHLHIAALNTFLACCHPELSILNHTPYDMNWSLHYTGRLIMFKFASHKTYSAHEDETTSSEHSKIITADDGRLKERECTYAI